MNSDHHDTPQMLLIPKTKHHWSQRLSEHYWRESVDAAETRGTEGDSKSPHHNHHSQAREYCCRVKNREFIKVIIIILHNKSSTKHHQSQRLSEHYWRVSVDAAET